MPPPRAVIVDFAGVLTNSSEECFADFSTRAGLPAGTLTALLRTDPSLCALREALERGMVPQSEFEAGVAARLGQRPERLIARMLAALTLEPAVLGVVHRARRAGIRVACLSNAWRTGPYDPYQPWRLTTEFDAVVLSCETGLRKPDPRIYLLTCERLGVAAADCVMVDDNAANLVPAADLGMTTVLCRSPAQAAADLTAALGR